MSQPSQKELLYCLKNKAKIMDDEMRDILWSAYQRQRDHNKGFGPAEHEAWINFKELEESLSQRPVDDTIRAVMAKKKEEDKIVQLETRIDELESHFNALADAILEMERRLNNVAK